MLRCLILALLFCSIYASAQLIVPQDTLIWSSSRPLTFADYTGRPSASGFAAATTVMLYAKPRNERNALDWEIFATFSKSRSWVDPAQANDQQLLRHERLHFDICEIHAREFRRFVAEYEGPYAPATGEQMSRIFVARKALLDAEQRLYDAETRHSQAHAVQQRWEQDVSQRLRELEAYRR